MKITRNPLIFIGGAEGARTPDLLIASQNQSLCKTLAHFVCVGKSNS